MWSTGCSAAGCTFVIRPLPPIPSAFGAALAATTFGRNDCYQALEQNLSLQGSAEEEIYGCSGELAQHKVQRVSSDLGLLQQRICI